MVFCRCCCCCCQTTQSESKIEQNFSNRGDGSNVSFIYNNELESLYAYYILNSELISFIYHLRANI